MTSQNRSEGRRQLAAFLSSAFDTEELRWAASQSDLLVPAVDRVNWDRPRADVFADFIKVLERNGLIGDAFFQMLETERPARTHEIRLIRQAWVSVTPTEVGEAENGGTVRHRKLVYEALLALTSSDFDRLVLVELDSSARAAVPHKSGQAEMAQQLVSHFGGSGRHLSSLAASIRIIAPGLIDDVCYQAIVDFETGDVRPPSGSTPEPDAREVVLLIHGIRTFANWQPMVQRVLEEIPGKTVIPIKYGYLNAFRFWFPWFTRQAAIDDIRREIQNARNKYNDAKISIIAHSFGTYAVLTILEENPDFHFHRLILSGSIVPRSYRWDHVSERLATEAVNDYGTRDIWPVLAKCLSWGYGDTGRHGFGRVGVQDRGHDYKHSDFFNEDFVREYWRPLFAKGRLVRSQWGEKSPPPSWFLGVLSFLPVKAVCALALAVGVYLHWGRTVTPPKKPPTGEINQHRPATKALLSAEENPDGTATLKVQYNHPSEGFHVTTMALDLEQFGPEVPLERQPSSMVKDVLYDVQIPANIFETDAPTIRKTTHFFHDPKEPYALMSLTLWFGKPNRQVTFKLTPRFFDSDGKEIQLVRDPESVQITLWNSPLFIASPRPDN